MTNQTIKIKDLGEATVLFEYTVGDYIVHLQNKIGRYFVSRDGKYHFHILEELKAHY